MPEGHTLHRLARQIDRLFVGRPWKVSSPQGRFDAGAARLDGRTPDRAQAWGKHLFIHVGADIWQVHLGLYGAFSFRGDEQFTQGETALTLGAPRAAAQQLQPEYEDAGWIIPEAPQGAVRARIRSQHGWADLRGPATCAVLTAIDYEKVIRRLGPDPLRQPEGGWDPQGREQFLQNISRRRISIGAALMDQAVIAGVGNIYRAESLFLEEISPDTPSSSISREQGEALWSRLTQQLRHGVAEGVIRTLRPEEADGEESDGVGGSAAVRSTDARAGLTHDYYAGRVRDVERRHHVYQHQGTPCLRCGETIAMRELQGRRLYWCPGCQTG